MVVKGFTATAPSCQKFEEKYLSLVRSSSFIFPYFPLTNGNLKKLFIFPAILSPFPGWTRTPGLEMMRNFYYHCANAAGLLAIKVEFLNVMLHLETLAYRFSLPVSPVLRITLKNCECWL
jgi:hypothetical protein